MLRIRLGDSQRSDLQVLRRSDLPAVARDRLEMVFLSDAGWSPPRIAQYLGRHPHTVRAALKGFAARGTAAFYPDAPGPDPNHARRGQVTGRLRELLADPVDVAPPEILERGVPPGELVGRSADAGHARAAGS